MKVRHILSAVATLIAAFGGVRAFGAEIVVHRANVDLALNAACANPYTNVHDGVWSYMKTSGAGLDGTRSLLANIHTRGVLHGLGSGSVSAGDTGPGWILVNARGTNAFNGAVNNSVPIPGGSLLMHPGSSHRTVLRFTVPRDGTYAASGYIDGAMTLQTGKIAGDVVVNGASVWNTTITRAPSDADRSGEKVSFVTDDLDLKAGDTIELVIFNGDSYAGDCTGVNFDVTEKACPVTFIDPNAVIAAQFASDVPVQPFVGSHDDWWSLLSTSNHAASVYARLTSHCTNPDVYTATKNVFVGSFAVSALGGYYCRIQALTLETFACHEDGNGDWAVAPGELWMHTGPLSGQKYSSVLRFHAGAPGVYAVNVNVRDMNANGNGVKVYVRDRSGVLAEATVNLNAVKSAQIRIPPRAFPRMDWLEFVVDSLGDISGDGTGVTLAVKKISDGLPEGWCDLNQDLVGHFPGSANPASSAVNPFVTDAGYSWAFGLFDSAKRTYAALNERSTWTLSSCGEAGWTTTGEPFIFQTAASTPTRPYRRSSIDAGCVLHALPKELNMRGDTNRCATVRYTANADGVYSVCASLRHLIRDTSGSRAAVRLDANRYPAATGRIYNSSAGFEEGGLAPLDIYLRKGQTLSLDVWSVDGHVSGSGDDATGLFASLGRTDASGQILSLDINGAAAGESAVTFDGAGRIGYTDEQRWNSLRVSNGGADAHSSALLFADGARSNVRATLASSSGILSATAAGAAGNALTGDGVVSMNANEAVTLTLTGLAPEADYELFLYGDGVERGVFTIGERSAACDEPWFSPDGADVVRLSGTADADGSLAIVFRAGTSGNPARFSGLQLRGSTFPKFVPAGFMIIFR